MRFEILLLAALISHAGGGLLGQSGPPPESQAPTASLRISPPSATLKVGFPIYLTVDLKNSSRHDIWVYRPPELAYQTQVRDAADRPVKPAFPRTSCDKNGRRVTRMRLPGGPIGLTDLSPGKSVTDAVIVSDDYELTEPGKYSVQVEWQDPETKAIVSSNSVTLTLTP